MEKLAIYGGPKVLEEILPREWPGKHWIDHEEEEAVIRALHGDNEAANLADRLKEFFDVPCARAVNTGTGALFTALAALDIGPGMEVIVPGFCWIPTFACVVSRGAIPVLVEVGEDLGVDPVDLEKKITDRTRAVIVVHMCGAPADMDPIMAIAEKHDLLVIEDCAQHVTGKYKGRYVGTIGDIGCFSMQQNKHITTFMGGFMISRKEDLGTAISLAGDAGLGRSMGVVDPTLDVEARWGQGRGIGRLARAMACVQLRKSPRILASLRRAHRRIKDGVGDIPGLRFRPLANPEDEAGSFLISYWPDEKTAARAAEALKAEGVPEWIFHLQEYGAHMYYYQNALVKKIGWTSGMGCPWDCPKNKGCEKYTYDKGSAPQSDEIFSRGVVMAVPSILTDEQSDRIAYAYRKVASHLLGFAASDSESEDQLASCAL